MPHQLELTEELAIQKKELERERKLKLSGRTSETAKEEKKAESKVKKVAKKLFGKKKK